jgi:hypothetical protein
VGISSVQLLAIVCLSKDLTILLNGAILQRTKLDIELLLSSVDKSVILAHLMDEDPDPVCEVVVVHSEQVHENGVIRLPERQLANEVQNLKHKYRINVLSLFKEIE